MPQTTHRSVDVAIVGAGTAGLAAYHAAVARTPRVVLIEHGPQGTTCTRVGCMPSKLLLAAAEVAHSARHAARFGIDCDVQVDGRAVMARVRRERDRFVDLAAAETSLIAAEDRILGHARFTAPHMLEVNGESIEAGAVVIATGSSASVPSAFDAVRDRVVVSDDVFEWTTLPESLAVFGAGPLGIELGQAFHRLGVRVRVFGRGGGLGPLTDPVVRAAALAAIGSEMPLDPDAKVVAVRRCGEGVEVHFEDLGGRSRVETFAFALIATGRRPNVDGLGLEIAGVSLDRKGIPVVDRETMQCGSSSVFIAGDASHGTPVLHEAVDEGHIAGDNAALYPTVLPGARRSRLQITFCEPQLTVVGPGFEKLSKEGEIVTGEVSFEDQGRSRIMGRNCGLGHVYAEPVSGRFLGAEIVGPCAEHLGHLLAWAHQQKVAIDLMLAMPVYHPVVEEGLRTALRDVRAKCRAGNDGGHGSRFLQMPDRDRRTAMKKASKETNAVEGEGSYTATRAYNAGLAKANKEGHSRELGEKASNALDGPEGDSLREADRIGTIGHPKRARKG
jgi:dihydrolipoamide dehydrogenase